MSFGMSFMRVMGSRASFRFSKFLLVHGYHSMEMGYLCGYLPMNASRVGHDHDTPPLLLLTFRGISIDIINFWLWWRAYLLTYLLYVHVGLYDVCPSSAAPNAEGIRSSRYRSERYYSSPRVIPSPPASSSSSPTPSSSPSKTIIFSPLASVPSLT